MLECLDPSSGGSDDWAKGKGGAKFVYLLELRPGEEGKRVFSFVGTIQNELMMMKSINQNLTLSFPLSIALLSPAQNEQAFQKISLTTAKQGRKR